MSVINWEMPRPYSCSKGRASSADLVNQPCRRGTKCRSKRRGEHPRSTLVEAGPLLSLRIEIEAVGVLD